MKTYSEKRFFEWHEDNLSVSLRAMSGSYGGGSEVLVLESNQNHATAQETEVCPCLPAAMGMGGGYVPMIVVQRRFSNVVVQDTDVSPTIEAGSGGGGNNLPMIMAAYTCREFGRYENTDVSSCLRVKEPYGGGETLVVDALPFDTTQITSDKNWSHPKYGDPCHPLAQNQHPPSVVIKEGE